MVITFGSSRKHQQDTAHYVKRVSSKECADHLRAIDIFAGCGGLSFGLKAAGFKVVGAVEVDETAAATYKKNHRGVDVRQLDIRDVDPRSWMKDLGLKPGELDLIAGCPPCQGFSTLRTRNGAKRNADRRNTLARQMIRFVRAL